MKLNTTCLIILSILSSIAVSAQNSPFKLKPHVRGVTPQTAAKSTALASRLIAAAGDEYNIDSLAFIYTDSGAVVYSGQRGGDLEHILKYDNGSMWWNNGSGLEETEHMSQTFDGNDNILSTLVQEWNGSAWENSYGTVTTYDVDNYITTITEVEWNTGTNQWDSLSRLTYTYDQNHNLLSEIEITWNGSAWENSYGNVYTLDMNGNRILDVMMFWNGTAWDSMGKQHYVYNSNNLAIEWWDESWQTSAWQKHNRDLMVYDLNDHMVTRTTHSWNGSTWIVSRIYTYTWNGNDLVNILQEYANGDDITLETNTYDGNHNMLTHIQQLWFNQAWVNQRKNEWTYNSFDQATSDRVYSWVGGNWGDANGNNRNRYYYETYTASVDEVEKDNSFNAYPSPASHYIRVEKTWDEPQAFSVSVLDMQGRLLNLYNEKPTAQYARTIDLSRLPAGNYIIKLVGSKEQAQYKKITVVR